MQTKPLIAVLAVVLLLIIAFLAFSMDQDDMTTETATTTTTGAPVTDTTPPVTDDTPEAVTITYSADGFSPSTLTVKVGTTVTWVNNGSGRMWVGTNDHPTHTNYDGSSTSEHCANGTATSPDVFDQCGAGTRYSFTFDKTGSWGYHNHADASHRGTITVTQ